MYQFQTSADSKTGLRSVEVPLRGAALLQQPLYNKDTAFTGAERDALGLRGLLPPGVQTIEQQLDRAYAHFQSQPDDISKFVCLAELQNRNETLYYRLLADHVDEMVPVVYTPVVGRFCQEYHKLFRRSRGLFITANDVDRMEEVLRNAPFSNVSVIVATDSEAILGIGDQGAGGMGIPIGKLALYTMGAGIHPSRCLPVCLDVGTNDEAKRGEDLYLGVRESRASGDAYFRVVDAFVDGVRKVFPDAVVQWEDLSRQNAWSVLERHRENVCSFNDDIQGTGAVVLSGVFAAAGIMDRPLKDQRFCVLGLGASGSGIVMTILAALRQEGLSEKEAMARFITLDSRGAVIEGREGLAEYKKPFAREKELVSGWQLDQADRILLPDVVRNFKPTVLIGTSGQPRSFTEEVVKGMAANCERPVILALSNPTSKTEVLPADAWKWSEGRALIATGSPFASETVNGVERRVPQCNNALCFPGLGLGILVGQARQMTDGMLIAAAKAVEESLTPEDRKTGSLYPRIDDMRAISRLVARRTAEAAVADGVSSETGLTAEKIADRVSEEVWEPEYLPYKPV